jgi:hypothetical protein
MVEGRGGQAGGEEEEARAWGRAARVRLTSEGGDGGGGGCRGKEVENRLDLREEGSEG